MKGKNKGILYGGFTLDLLSAFTLEGNKNWPHSSDNRACALLFYSILRILAHSQHNFLNDLVEFNAVSFRRDTMRYKTKYE